MAILVEDVMTRKVVAVKKEYTVRELTKVMTENRISCVLIIDSSQMVGIVTERDVVEKVVSTDHDPDKLNASDIMSKPVVTIGVKADLDDAARLMRDKRIRKLVAERDGKVEGIVTSYDIVAAEPVIRLLVERKI